MQSKNAVGNLINRYRAVLKKCHLLNTFGTLAIVSTLTLGAGLANVENAFAASLSDIDSDIHEETGSRTAGILRSLRDVTLSHITAGIGATDSTIERGATLTLTGQSNNLLIEGNMTNNGTLKLGTALDSSATGIIGGNLENSAGNITAQSKLKVERYLTLDGGTAIFERDLTVTGATTLSGGTNTFRGTSTFTGAVTNSNNAGTNEFSGNATFQANYTGEGNATFNGVTTFQGAYTNTGESTFTGNTTFQNTYADTGTLNVKDATTNFVNGYDSDGNLNVNNANNDANAKVTIGAGTNMTIGSGGTLNIANGTVDVSNGSLFVDGGATTFSTGTNGVLKAKAADFATFTDNSGVLTASNLLGGNVKKQLDNDGRLILTGLSGSMAYDDYDDLLGTASVLISGGTLQLENVSINTTGLSLSDIQTGTDLPNNMVDGGDFAAGKTAILSGVDGDMNNSGTLTFTGKYNNVLVQGSAINSAGATLNLQNGGITGSLTNNSTVNINGATVVDGATILRNTANLNVQSGSFTAKGDIIFTNATVRTSGSSGNSISQASATFLPNLPNGIDGHVIAEQGSYVVLGAGDSNYATNAFSTSNQDWDTNLTAALFISSPQELKNTGSIMVNGANTGLSSAGGNNANFAANSILVVDGAGLNGNVALTASSGKLTVESGAKLHIANAVSGTTVHVVSGFTSGSIADGGWEGDNLSSSTGLQVAQVTDFDPADGSYSVKIIGSSVEQIKKDFPKLQENTAVLLAELAKKANVNSTEESIRFFSIIMDDTVGIGKNNPNEAAKVIESVLQVAQAGGASKTVINTNISATNNLISRLSQAGFNLGQAPQVVQANTMQTGYSAGSESKTDILNGLALWVSPMYKHSSVSGVEAGNFSHSYDSDFKGVSLGGDYTFQNMYRMGLAFNVGAGDTKSTGGLSNTKNDFSFFGISTYGAYYQDKLTLMADIGFNETSGEFSQAINVAGLSNLSANTDSMSFTMALNAEYTFNTEYMDATPYAGMRYMYVHTDAYNTKNNNGIVAQTQSDSQHILYIPIGVTFSKEIANSSDWAFKPNVGLGFITAIGDLHSNSVSSIPNVVGSSEYSIQNVDSIAFDGGIGIDIAHPEKNLSFGLDYNLQASKHETAHTLNAMFRYEF